MLLAVGVARPLCGCIVVQAFTSDIIAATTRTEGDLDLVATTWRDSLAH